MCVYNYLRLAKQTVAYYILIRSKCNVCVPACTRRFENLGVSYGQSAKSVIITIMNSINLSAHTRRFENFREKCSKEALY